MEAIAHWTLKNNASKQVDNYLQKYESLHRILGEMHQVIIVLLCVYNLYCNFFLLLLLSGCDAPALYLGS